MPIPFAKERAQLAQHDHDNGYSYIDGIHYDRIRYPGPQYSHDPVSVERFAGPGNPGGFGWEDWQREQLNKLINDLYARIAEVKPWLRVSCSAWGIYNHFDSKEEIFEAVFLESHPFIEMIPVIDNIQGNTIEEMIRDAAAHMLTAIHNRPGFLNLMFIEIVEFNSVHTHVMFESAFPQGLQIVQKFTKAKGKLRPLPPQMVVRAFVGMFFSYYLAEVILGDAAPSVFKENAMDYQIDILLHGILDK